MNKNLKKIIIIISLLIITAIILVIVINILDKTNEEKEEENNYINSNEINIISDKELDEARDELIGSQSEFSRIKAYVGRFYATLEKKDYDTAYAMLYDSFKDNYFKTIEDFKAYIEKNYPENIVLNYGTNEKEGELYIINLEVIDGLNNTNKFNQRVVLQENGLNDFNISFQVINKDQ